MRMYTSLMMACILILMSSCANQGKANPLEGTKPPIPSVQVDDMKILVVRSAYCWVECSENASIPELLDGKVIREVAGNSEIIIDFNSESIPDNITLSIYDERMVRKDNQPWKVPNKPGIYYFAINAVWNNKIEADAE
ncbi:hypothetical protein [Sutcliffiella rhizosphaerae]|uniref:Lipoprotein n=1 Tax=Sutcliffiella rhizosphaerae TaxID=2880967 RepID=A0ABM8YT99_9BACI|nr:hypothetical protein [Sutcliffiella rhizosphaerae]CAG9623200.1 hypothetical protein BACCIP111883_03996 [Sutcliffiella rhizosphaerae]